MNNEITRKVFYWKEKNYKGEDVKVKWSTFIFYNQKEVFIKPNHTWLIWLGYGFNIPPYTKLLLYLHNEICFAGGLLAGGKVVSYGYHKEIAVSITNTFEKELFLRKGEELCYGFLTRVLPFQTMEVEKKEDCLKEIS